MLLRRLTQHIRAQNWFAVSLDFLIVVLGIFIGLQVDAWNDSRMERTLETEYLERLLDDMERSIELQMEMLADDRAGQAAMDVIARGINRGSFEPGEMNAVVDGLEWIGWVTRPATITITVNELQATGNIALIRSVELREALGEMELSLQMALYSAEQTSTMIAAVQQQVGNWAFVAPNPEVDFGYVIQPDLGQILANPAAGNLTSWIASWSRFNSSVLVRHHQDTVKLRDLLREELGETGRS